MHLIATNTNSKDQGESTNICMMTRTLLELVLVLCTIEKVRIRRVKR